MIKKKHTPAATMLIQTPFLKTQTPYLQQFMILQVININYKKVTKMMQLYY